MKVTTRINYETEAPNGTILHLPFYSDHFDEAEITPVEGGGWRLTALVLDFDPEPHNPREFTDGNMLWLGFEHRRYKIGDETFDPTCPHCGGQAYWVNGEGDDEDCPHCGGAGEAMTLAKAIEFTRHRYDAVAVWQVGMIDHSGLSFYLGGGAHWCDPGGWDSGTCGLLVLSRERLREWGHEVPEGEPTPDQLATYTEWARGEISEYDAWSTGDMYGIVDWVFDADGEATDDTTCWGYIGYEYALSELEAMRQR